ncbi:hypothetical protein D3C71_2169640 [compost metagenome]
MLAVLVVGFTDSTRVEGAATRSALRCACSVIEAVEFGLTRRMRMDQAVFALRAAKEAMSGARISNCRSEVM